MRVFSYGGGVQSTAALVLAAEGRIDFPTFIFCNVGADSENPQTLAYVDQVAKPFAAAHGIDLQELRRTRRDGSFETLLAWVLRSTSSVYLPLRTADGAPGNRSCTGDFKIKVVARWLKAHGATAEKPAVSGLGISVDEFQRARSSSGFSWQQLTYPLLDLHLTRRDCQRIIGAAGLPLPAKSSCYFCPFHRIADWRRLRVERPDLFARAVEIEQVLSARSVRLGRPPVWLTRYGRPLDQVIGDQSAFDFEDSCESGYCMT